MEGGRMQATSGTVNQRNSCSLQHSQVQHRVPWNKVKMNFGNVNYFAMPSCGAYLKWQWEHGILSRCKWYFCILFVLVMKEERWQREVFTSYPEQGKGHIFTCFSVGGQRGAFQPIPCSLPCVSPGGATGNSKEVIWLHDNLPCPLNRW